MEEKRDTANDGGTSAASATTPLLPPPPPPMASSSSSVAGPPAAAAAAGGAVASAAAAAPSTAAVPPPVQVSVAEVAKVARREQQQQQQDQSTQTQNNKTKTTTRQQLLGIVRRIHKQVCADVARDEAARVARYLSPSARQQWWSSAHHRDNSENDGNGQGQDDDNDDCTSFPLLEPTRTATATTGTAGTAAISQQQQRLMSSNVTDDAAVPRAMQTCVFLRKSWYTKDAEELEFVAPRDDDEDGEDDDHDDDDDQKKKKKTSAKRELESGLRELHSIKARQARLDAGPLHQQQRTREILDRFIPACCFDDTEIQQQQQVIGDSGSDSCTTMLLLPPQQTTNHITDGTTDTVATSHNNSNDDQEQQQPTSKYLLLDLIAGVTRQKYSHIAQLYEELAKTMSSSEQQSTTTTTAAATNPTTIAAAAAAVADDHKQPQQNDDDNDDDDDNDFYDDPDYLTSIENFRMMYCRQCCTYDCEIHELPEAVPDLQFQYEFNMQRFRDGDWWPPALKQPPPAQALQQPPVQPHLPPPPSQQQQLQQQQQKSTTTSITAQPTTPDSQPAELTAFQKSICRRLFLIYEGNIGQMAVIMRAPRHLVEAYVEQQQLKLPTRFDIVTKPTASNDKSSHTGYYNVKNYPRKWYRERQNPDQHPFFIPCLHCDAVCSDANCSCVKNNFFCTKSCAWSHRSRNFFRGCDCKARCQKGCSCRLANRECDPDLCKCDTCTVPHQTHPASPARGSAAAPQTEQRCLNDNISMRRHAHLLIGHSDLPDAGLGAFNKYPLRKGDFIAEYVGELIGEGEWERRGLIYTDRKCTYLFSQYSDMTIDAIRNGNIGRFLNSTNDDKQAINCESRPVFVNGDLRLGLFASENIPAQTELLFDYEGNGAIRFRCFPGQGTTNGGEGGKRTKQQVSRGKAKRKKPATKKASAGPGLKKPPPT